MRTLILSTLLLFNQISFGQQKTNVPKWFTQNMEESIGVWITDNAAYKNEKEPITSFAMEWTWGIGKQSIHGTLYGYINNKKVGPFWEFKQYWDTKKGMGIVMQQGPDGTLGIGQIINEGKGKTKMIQIFTNPEGKSRTLGHKSIMTSSALVTESFDIDAAQKWSKRRKYSWVKQSSKERKSDSNQFSISLSVKNVKASMEFYQKLGFNIIKGSIEQRWLLMTNGYAKIGLFQGMFPTNTLTLNPEDARSAFKKAVKAKIPILMQNGMDRSKGKASFMISDPDGNPILFDQH